MTKNRMIKIGATLMALGGAVGWLFSLFGRETALDAGGIKSREVEVQKAQQNVLQLEDEVRRLEKKELRYHFEGKVLSWE